MKKLMVSMTLGLIIYLISACAPAAAPVNPTVSPVYSVTPRGNKLEATDPSMVSLSNGKLTFVEFFRFT